MHDLDCDTLSKKLHSAHDTQEALASEQDDILKHLQSLIQGMDPPDQQRELLEALCMELQLRTREMHRAINTCAEASQAQTGVVRALAREVRRLRSEAKDLKEENDLLNGMQVGPSRPLAASSSVFDCDVSGGDRAGGLRQDRCLGRLRLGGGHCVAEGSQ